MSTSEKWLVPCRPIKTSTSRADHEVHECADLCGWHVSREMEDVKRKPLARPIREQFDKFAPAQKILGPKRKDLGYAMACNAGAQHRANIVDGQAAGNRDGELLPATVELPGKRSTRVWVQVVNALVLSLAKLARMLRTAMPGQIRWRSTCQDSGFQQPPCDKSGRLRLAKAHGGIEPVSHEITEAIAPDDLHRQLRIGREEFAEARGEHNACKERIDIDSELR
jgi:hypothetical protein